MINLLVVGDGPRDQSALPILIGQLLGCEIQSRYDDLHEIRYLKGKGDIHARKVKYLSRRACADRFDGLAVVVDTDKSPRREKLKNLRKGRKEDREKNPPFPTALGEAKPHFDVWLLDEPVAIREALGFSADFDNVNAVKVEYPKDELSKLVESSEFEFDQVSDALGAIAKRISLQRCVHPKDTGLAAFAEDLDAEIKPVTGIVD
ncbi:MAG: hypothetical protein KDA52_13380 [Planctomycetaceae bacterium]|nr:hypothetical protein [Planctomycetaceae bacterium]